MKFLFSVDVLSIRILVYMYNNWRSRIYTQYIHIRPHMCIICATKENMKINVATTIEIPNAF